MEGEGGGEGVGENKEEGVKMEREGWRGLIALGIMEMRELGGKNHE